MPSSVVRALSNDLAIYVAKYINLNPSPDLTDNVTNAINAYIFDKGNGLDIPLASVSVDFEANKAEMESILTANPVWKDTITASTGQIILEMVATALTYMQYNIVRSAQETMLDTARIDSSIFAATRHLGVRIARRIPASCNVTLNRTGDLTESLEILPYSQFSTNNNQFNVNLFNRSSIIFPANITTVNANLLHGLVGNNAAFTSNGTAYQRFYVGSDDYAISNLDIVCAVNDILWSRAQFNDYFSIGMWEYGPQDTVFSDDTTAEGSVEIEFGNGLYGKIPPTGSRIAITYVTCNGADDNINMINSSVVATFSKYVAGIVTSSSVGGTNALNARDYKSLSPGLYAAKYRATTRQDSAALARRYAGVIDAIFEGQQELAPADLRQMLIERATLLTNTPWTVDDFSRFKAWFENLDIANMRIYYNAPTAVPLVIAANIFCKDNTSLDSIKNNIKANLVKAFEVKPGILGYKRAVSDISDIIKRTNRSLIDYLDIIAPTIDVEVTADQYVVLDVNNITLNMAYTQRLEQ